MNHNSEDQTANNNNSVGSGGGANISTSTTLNTRTTTPLTQRILLNVSSAGDNQSIVSVNNHHQSSQQLLLTTSSQDSTGTQQSSVGAQLSKLVTISSATGSSVKLPQIVLKQVSSGGGQQTSLIQTSAHGTLVNSGNSSNHHLSNSSNNQSTISTGLNQTAGTSTSNIVTSASVSNNIGNYTISMINNKNGSLSTGSSNINSGNNSSSSSTSNSSTTTALSTAPNNISLSASEVVNAIALNNNQISIQNGRFISRVPISDDGMGHCIRCGAVGVKDTFYGKGKQYCSATCVRGLPPQQPQAPLFKIVTLPINKFTGNSSNSSETSNQMVTVAVPVSVSTPPSTSVSNLKQQQNTKDSNTTQTQQSIQQQLQQATITAKQLNSSNRLIIRQQQQQQQQQGNKITAKSLVNSHRTIAAQLTNSSNINTSTTTSNNHINSGQQIFLNSLGSGHQQIPPGTTTVALTNAQLAQLDSTGTVGVQVVGGNKTNLKRSYSKVSVSMSNSSTQLTPTNNSQTSSVSVLNTPTSGSVPAKRTKRNSQSTGSATGSICTGTLNTGGKKSKQSVKLIDAFDNHVVSSNSSVVPSQVSTLHHHSVVSSVQLVPSSSTSSSSQSSLSSSSSPSPATSTQLMNVSKTIQSLSTSSPAHIIQQLNNSNSSTLSLNHLHQHQFHAANTGVTFMHGQPSPVGKSSSSTNSPNSILISQLMRKPGESLLGVQDQTAIPSTPPPPSSSSSTNPAALLVQLTSPSPSHHQHQHSSSSPLVSNQQSQQPQQPSVSIQTQQSAQQFQHFLQQHQKKLALQLQQQQQQQSRSTTTSNVLTSSPAKPCDQQQSSSVNSRLAQILAQNTPSSPVVTSNHSQPQTIASILTAASQQLPNSNATPAPKAAKPEPPKLSKLEEIKLLDSAVLASNSSSSTTNSYPPVWCMVFDKYGYDKCAPVDSFVNVPLAQHWSMLSSQSKDTNNESNTAPMVCLELRVSDKILHNHVNASTNNGTNSSMNNSATTVSINKTKAKKNLFDSFDMNDDCFWFAKIMGYSGYYLRLRYLGLENNSHYDFWVNIRLRNLYPVGHAKRNGFKYKPPKEVLELNPFDYRAEVRHLLPTSKSINIDFYSKFAQESKCELKCGIRVEAVDKSRFSCFRVATVDKIVGKRVHVNYDGESPDDLGFWTHLSSGYIRPVGWSQLVGHELYASKDYALKSLQKAVHTVKQHLKSCSSTASARSFDIKKLGILSKFETHDDDVQFKEGMKLEAVDPYNLSTICVATVKRVLRFNFIAIGIDNCVDETKSLDWFCCHSSSPYLLPAGFCATHNIPLSSPLGYNRKFDWVEYCLYTDSLMAPIDFFSCKNFNHSFEEGMLLEAVDLVEPNLICVAIIKRVAGRLLLLHFIGWEDVYDQWCDCYSPNIFPVGYCDLIDYPLQGPPNSGKGGVDKKRKTPSKKKRKGNSTPNKTKLSTSDVVSVKKESNSSTLEKILDNKTNQNGIMDGNLSDSNEHDGAMGDGVLANNGDEAIDGDVDEDDDSDCQLLNEEYHFMNENEQITNDGIFVEFNSMADRLANTIDIGDGKEICFLSQAKKSNCITFRDKEDKFVVNLLYQDDGDQQRLKEIFDKPPSLPLLFPSTATTTPDQVAKFDTHSSSDESDCSSVVQYLTSKHFYKDVDLDCTDLTQIPQWTPYQVAKFLMQHNFEQYYDSIVVNKIDGKKLLRLTKRQALRLTLYLGPAMKLLYLVDKIRNQLKLRTV